MNKLTIIIATLILTAGLSSFATEKKINLVVTEKEYYQLSFNKIVLANNINMRLSESTDRIIEISGNNKYTEDVEWKIKNGVLYIRSTAGSLKNKVEVNVSVNQLNAIAVTGDSDVRSDGALNSEELKVFVNGGGHIEIKNTGSISLEKADYIDFNIHKVLGKVKVG